MGAHHRWNKYKLYVGGSVKKKIYNIPNVTEFSKSILICRYDLIRIRPSCFSRRAT